MTKSKCRVSDLRQSRRHERMNGSKPYGPSGNPQTSGKCQRGSHSERHLPPSPQPSPSGREFPECYARIAPLNLHLRVAPSPHPSPPPGGGGCPKGGGGGGSWAGGILRWLSEHPARCLPD